MDALKRTLLITGSAIVAAGLFTGIFFAADRWFAGILP